MQNKTTQHKHRTLYAFKKSSQVVKNKKMIKDYIIIIINKI